MCWYLVQAADKATEISLATNGALHFLLCTKLRSNFKADQTANFKISTEICRVQVHLVPVDVCMSSLSWGQHLHIYYVQHKALLTQFAFNLNLFWHYCEFLSTQKCLKNIFWGLLLQRIQCPHFKSFCIKSLSHILPVSWEHMRSACKIDRPTAAQLVNIHVGIENLYIRLIIMLFQRSLFPHQKTWQTCYILHFCQTQFTSLPSLSQSTQHRELGGSTWLAGPLPCHPILWSFSVKVCFCWNRALFCDTAN
jgi:hypothetical protein